jgi:alpha-1,2-mannosyltransferase
MAGGDAVANSAPLYEVAVPNGVDGVLRFTYPPFAAMVFVSLAALGWASSAVFTGCSLIAYLAVVLTNTRVMQASRQVSIALAALGLALEPVQRTLLFGQVNLTLLALVLFDAFVVPSRWRGWLTGLAIGVKLTPGIVVLYFLLRRDFSAAARAIGGFLATVLLGFIVLPRDSLIFWFHDIHAVGRFGPEARLWGNQSISAVVDRATQLRDIPEPQTVCAVAALSIAALGLGLLAARHRLARYDPLGALTSVAVSGLLVAPISWTHHYVWVVPALFVLVRDRSYWWAGATSVIFFLPPMWGLAGRPNAQLGYTPSELVLSAAWALWAVALLGFWALGGGSGRQAIVPAHAGKEAAMPAARV